MCYRIVYYVTAPGLFFEILSSEEGPCTCRRLPGSKWRFPLKHAEDSLAHEILRTGLLCKRLSFARGPAEAEKHTSALRATRFAMIHIVNSKHFKNVCVLRRWYVFEVDFVKNRANLNFEDRSIQSRRMVIAM